MKTINIGIVEDNKFFIQALHKKLIRHAYQLERYWDCNFRLFVFNSGLEFLVYDKEAMDFLFLDYHLEDGIKAPAIIESKYQGEDCPRIVLVSEDGRSATSYLSKDKRVTNVIKKDAYVIPRTCILLEEFAKQELKKSA